MSVKYKQIWSDWITLDENVSVRHDNEMDRESVSYEFTFDGAPYKPCENP